MLERSIPTIEDQPLAWSYDLVEEIRRRREEVDGSFRIPIARVEAREILSAWRDEPVLFYWAGRGHGEIVVASGVADQVRSEGTLTPQELATVLREIENRAGAGVRYYGGLRFDPDQAASEEWQDYGTVNFFRPKFEVRIRQRSAVLLVAPSTVDDPLDEVDRWQFDVPSTNGRRPRIERKCDLPDREGWMERVEETLRRIRSQDIEKAVLARAVDLASDHDVDAIHLLEQIIDAAPSCYHMLFRPSRETAFVTATPERLIGRRGTRVVSEAVAGTRPRSVSMEDDARLRDELMASDKDRREHAVVGRSIVDALQQFASDVDIEKQPSEMRLATGRHLKSAIRAILLPGVGTADLVAAVHPTPAVGGHPTSGALELLRTIEPFDRGWYAGAIGWISQDEADLAVGIRSALVCGRHVRLYSGAGIVEGSVPEAEWDEIEQKIDGFLTVLRISG